MSHNATILQADQDYADYAERFNALAADPAIDREYQALRSKAGKLKAMERQSALRRLGSLNQWIEQQAELHPWHEYSPRIRRLVASSSSVGPSTATP